MSCHVVETTSELSAFMEAGVMAGSERDAGFCSGGDEDDMSGLHSPSASEDSVEVQVTPISLRNKRKLAEPRKIQEPSTAPLKKRRFGRIEETVVEDEESRPATSLSPFRPWSTSSKPHESKMTTSTTTTAATVITITSAPTVVCVPLSPENRDEEEEPRRKHESMIQQEILLRIQESNLRPESPAQDRSLMQRREPRQRFEPPPATVLPSEVTFPHPRLQEEPLALVLRGEVPRVPSHPAVNSGYERGSSYAVDHVSPSTHHVQSHQPATQTNHSRHQQGGQQRNYKNMTRERRIEANARERTRVHTISAAFDTLRRAIPAYSHNQKLSKLSVLRIACSYIMTLSKIVNTPDGESANGATLGACVDLVSRTIQTEGKLRKRKED